MSRNKKIRSEINLLSEYIHKWNLRQALGDYGLWSRNQLIKVAVNKIFQAKRGERELLVKLSDAQIKKLKRN